MSPTRCYIVRGAKAWLLRAVTRKPDAVADKAHSMLGEKLIALIDKLFDPKK